MSIDPSKIRAYAPEMNSFQPIGTPQSYKGRVYQKLEGFKTVPLSSRILKGIAAFSLTLLTLFVGLAFSPLRNLWDEALKNRKKIEVYVDAQTLPSSFKQVNQLATAILQKNSKVVPFSHLHTKRSLKTGVSRGQKIGELGEKWTFDSDHIPIGGEIKLGDPTNQNRATANVSFGSFNVLNTNALEWILKPENGGKPGGGTQGLDNSAITKNNQVKGKEGLTRREENTLQSVQEMLTPSKPGTVSRDFLALQECSPKFEAALRKRLGKSFPIISSSSTNSDKQLYIYNTKKLTCIQQDQPYSFQVNAGQNHNKKIQRMIFETKGKAHYSFSVIGVHLPGGKDSTQAREELGQFLVKNHNDSLPTLVLGDMNTETKNVGQSIQKAYERSELSNPFQYLTDGTPTHINTKQASADYDSMHYAPGASTIHYWENQPSKLLPELDSLSKLLTRA
jgi:hypothetical protein